MTAAFYDDPNYTYGTSTRKYDEQPATYDANRLHWRFEVAWVHPYNYWHETDGQTEVIYAVDCYWNRGRGSFIASDGSGLTRMEPGRMVIKLVNKDNRYDPNNSGSVLSGYISPGKLCRLGVRMASQSSYTWRFTGMIVDIRPSFTEEGESFVEFTIVDGWGWLQDRISFVPMLQDRSTTIGNLFLDVLEDIEWPKMWDVSANNDAYSLVWFWAGTKDARNILHDIAEVQMGRIYILGDGKLYYRQRTLSDSLAASLTQSDLLKDVPLNNPWENDWNYFEMSSRSLTDFNDYGTLWGDIITKQFNDYALSDTTVTPEYTIASGETITITGRFERPRNYTFEDEATFFFGHTGNGGSKCVAPYFEFWTGTGGTGTNRTGSVEVVSFRENGETFELVLMNNWSATVFSTFIMIIGYGKVFVPSASLNFSIDRSGGRVLRPIRINNPYSIFGGSFTASVFRDIVSDFASLVRSVNRLPTITLEAQPAKQFLDVNNRINLNIAKIGVNSDFRIGMIEERWLAPTAQAVRTTIKTEPYYIAS